MKALLTVSFLTLFIMTTHAQMSKLPAQEIPEDYGYIVEIGQKLPEISMQLTDGTSITNEDLNGKVVMLQFTASWCSVCRKEMPHIESEIWQRHKENKDFVLIGVDMNEPLEKVIQFQKDIKVTYPLALDPGAKIFYTFAAEGAGVTRNVIVDKKGNIVYLTRLYKEDEFNEMVQVIDYLIEN